MLENHNFTDADYQHVESEKNTKVGQQRQAMCDQALDEACDRFLAAGGDYGDQ